MNDRFYSDDQQPELPLFAKAHNDDADDATAEEAIGMIGRALGGGPPGGGTPPEDDSPDEGGFVPNGEKCTTCGQRVKVYKRTIYGAMAYLLIDLIWRQSDIGEDWTHVGAIHMPNGRDAGAAGGAFSLLRLWNLIEQKTNEKTEKRCSGLWRPTSKGVDFCSKRIKVTKYCHVYDNKIMGWSGPQVNVVDCLGEKFNYAELMRM